MNGQLNTTWTKTSQSCQNRHFPWPIKTRLKHRWKQLDKFAQHFTFAWSLKLQQQENIHRCGWYSCSYSGSLNWQFYRNIFLTNIVQGFITIFHDQCPITNTHTVTIPVIWGAIKQIYIHFLLIADKHCLVYPTHVRCPNPGGENSTSVHHWNCCIYFLQTNPVSKNMFAMSFQKTNLSNSELRRANEVIYILAFQFSQLNTSLMSQTLCFCILPSCPFCHNQETILPFILKGRYTRSVFYFGQFHPSFDRFLCNTQGVHNFYIACLQKDCANHAIQLQSHTWIMLTALKETVKFFFDLKILFCGKNYVLSNLKSFKFFLDYSLWKTVLHHGKQNHKWHRTQGFGGVHSCSIYDIFCGVNVAALAHFNLPRYTSSKQHPATNWLDHLCFGYFCKHLLGNTFACFRATQYFHFRLHQSFQAALMMVHTAWCRYYWYFGHWWLQVSSRFPGNGFEANLSLVLETPHTLLVFQ